MCEKAAISGKGEWGKRGILISHMEGNIEGAESVKCQQVINLLANGGKKPTAGSWESSYRETTMIMDALLTNKASQRVDKISKRLRDRSF